MFKKYLFSLTASILVSYSSFVSAAPTETTWQAYENFRQYYPIFYANTYNAQSIGLLADAQPSGEAYFYRYEYPRGYVPYKVIGIPTITNDGWRAGADCEAINFISGFWEQNTWNWEQSLDAPAIANGQTGTAYFTNWSGVGSYITVSCEDGILTEAL